MTIQWIRILFIASVASILVRAQNDGKYRPSSGNDGRYRPSNDGKYVHDDEKYVHTKDQFGEFGASEPFDGVVNIGGRRPQQKIAEQTPTIATTSSPPLATLPPSPPIFIIDNNNRNAAVSNNQDNDGPSSTKAGFKIIRQEQETSENGFHYLYETENGIAAEESGQIERLDNGADALRTIGFYLYTGDDGKEYRVDYTADENGFIAKGDHLPTPPPIPPEIQELLNDLATKQQDGN